MNRIDFANLQSHIFDSASDLSNTKGNDYAGNEDALANFKRHSNSLGLTPEQIWAVYAGKHWDAIITYCKDGEVKSEPIEGRILDAITYLTLLYGLVVEKHEDVQKKKVNKLEEMGF